MFSTSISKLNSPTNYVFITATFGILFSMLHFVHKQEEKYSSQFEIIQRKLKIISLECEDMRNQLEKMKEQQKNNESCMPHEREHEDEDYCVEEIDDDDLTTRTRSRSHSLSSVLGTAKKLVFG